ncbi:MAG: GTP-binding protein, partial [Candidatus Puniceispirillum sp.]
MTQSAAPEGPIPVTLVTGFLGAGKTTLINHILTQQSGLRFAVIVNEFGAIGIDHDLIISSSETLLELSNGCVCCTIRSDLVTSLRGLLADGRRFDGIFVETTGLADPAPVVQTFMFDQILAAKAYLDSVVTLVDAGHISAQLGRYAEVSNQLLLATII